MKAVVQDMYGPTEVLDLRDIATPEPGPDDVLVQVRAAGVNPADWHCMTGMPYLMRLMGFGLRAPASRTRGLDVAGRVEAVGTNVTRFRPGDEVYGTCEGSFAEYARGRQDRLAPKPASTSPSSRRQPFPPPPSPPSRACATEGRCRQDTRSWSSARREA